MFYSKNIRKIQQAINQFQSSENSSELPPFQQANGQVKTFTSEILNNMNQAQGNENNNVANLFQPTPRLSSQQASSALNSPLNSKITSHQPDLSISREFNLQKIQNIRNMQATMVPNAHFQQHP